MDQSNETYFQVSVKGLFFNDKGQLLMVQEDNGMWEVPGGRVQKGEDLAQCLKRECLEETGLDCEVLEQHPVIAYMALDQDGKPRIMLYYKIKFESLNFTPSNECVAMKFYTKEEMHDLLMVPQIKKLVKFL